MTKPTEAPYNDDFIPAQESITRVIRDHSAARWHPGLRVDRYFGLPESDKVSQEWQKQFLEMLCKGQNREDASETQVLESALARRAWLIAAAGASRTRTLSMRTVWRLAAHLSRASTLENGNTCLHPLYGFFYLPGSGLKGMARAYASRKDTPRTAPGWDEEDITRIMGSKSGDARGAEDLQAGRVAFLDALPERSPRLLLDIINNHHTKYYQHGGHPGDWEKPNMIYFLTVAPDTRFRFDLVHMGGSDASGDSARDLELAAHWLHGALAELGAGAKTAAGYGYFDDSSAELDQAKKRAPSVSAKTAATEPGSAYPAAQSEADIDSEIAKLNQAGLDGLIDELERMPPIWGARLIRYLSEVLYGQRYWGKLVEDARMSASPARRRMETIKALQGSGALKS